MVRNRRNKMKKSHLWDTFEILQATCPYCRKEIKNSYGCFDEGSSVNCPFCKREFELGKQK